MSLLTLESYAKILARLACRRGASVEEVLAELGIPVEDLGRDEPSLRAQLQGLLRGHKGVAAMKFATAIGEELEKLTLLGSGTPPPAARLLREPSAQIPSALLDPAAGDVPFRWGSETPSYVTAELRAAAAARMVPPLPAPDAPPVPPPAMHHAPLPPVASLPAAPPIAPLPILRAEQTSAPPLAGTANVDMSALVAAAQHGALPFTHPQSTPASIAEAAQLPPGAPKRSPSFSSGTMETDIRALVAAERGLLPFAHVDNGDDFDLSLLPLEAYASVSGELARGESREATLKGHGLTVEAFEILARAWAQRFQREPSLLEKFKELARSSAAAGRRGEGQR